MNRREDIDNGCAFDWGRVSEDYARYRDIYPPAFYEKIVELGLCIQGQDVLDLGTGTGVLPRNLYRYGARFTGADIEEKPIAQARRLSEEAGMDIRYVVSAAEDLDFPAGSFDVVTACQCFQYFDRAVVLPNIHRMLRQGGRLCILFMGWLPEESEIARHSEELVLQYNPAWTGGHLRRYRPEAPAGIGDLFQLETAMAYDVQVPFTRESWHGRIKACRGMGASCLPDEVIAQFEEEHRAYLRTVPEHFDILHYVTLISLRRRDKTAQEKKESRTAVAAGNATDM